MAWRLDDMARAAVQRAQGLLYPEGLLVTMMSRFDDVTHGEKFAKRLEHPDVAPGLTAARVEVPTLDKWAAACVTASQQLSDALTAARDQQAALGAAAKDPAALFHARTEGSKLFSLLGKNIDLVWPKDDEAHAGARATLLATLDEGL